MSLLECFGSISERASGLARSGLQLNEPWTRVSAKTRQRMRIPRVGRPWVGPGLCDFGSRRGGAAHFAHPSVDQLARDAERRRDLRQLVRAEPFGVGELVRIDGNLALGPVR